VEFHAWHKQRQHSISPLNLDELKEEKAVCSRGDEQIYGTGAAQDEVTPEDLWKRT